MISQVEPCRKFTLQGPPEFVCGDLHVEGRHVETAITEAFEKATYETPGGDCRQCGIVRVTVEFLES